MCIKNDFTNFAIHTQIINLPYRSHKESLLLEFFFPISFQRVGNSRGDGGDGVGGGSNFIYEWMNEKRRKWRKRFLGQVSSLQFFPSFSGILSFWQLQKPCRSLQVTRIHESSQWDFYFVFQLINKVPQLHCALGHHYYSPVGGLSRIWIHNFTWIVGERSKEDKILSLSTQSTPNISNCL